MDTSKRSHEASMTLDVVSFFFCCCLCVLMPKVQEPITMFHSTATRNRKILFAAFIRANNSQHHVAVEVLLVKIVLMTIFWRLDWNMSSVNCCHYTRHLADLRKSLNFFHSTLSCDRKLLERIQSMNKFMTTLYFSRF